MKHSLTIPLKGLQVNKAFLAALSSIINRHSNGPAVKLQIGELDLKYGANLWNADCTSGELTLTLELTEK